MEKFDILREVTVTELYKIRRYLRTHLPKSLSIYLFLENYMKWLDKTDAVSFEVLTFVDAKPTDVIICRLPDQDYNVVYSAESRFDILSKLWKSNKIQWTNGTTFGALPMSHRPVIMECISKRGVYVNDEVQNVAQHMDRMQAQQLAQIIPPGFEFRPLIEDDIQLVNDTWPYRFKGSEKFIGDMIRYNGGTMLCRQDNHEAVAWSLQNNYLGTGMLHVQPDYRRHGLGEIVLSSVIKYVATKTDYVTCTNSVGNASEVLIKRLGFKPYDNITWLFLSKLMKSSL